MSWFKCLVERPTFWRWPTSERCSPGDEETTVNEQHHLSLEHCVSLGFSLYSCRQQQQCLQADLAFCAPSSSSPSLCTHSLLSLCPTGRLGLATQDCHNCPQQVSLPVDFEAQRVLCGIDCSMIISSQHQLLACGNNRYSICQKTHISDIVCTNFRNMVILTWLQGCIIYWNFRQHVASWSVD